MKIISTLTLIIFLSLNGSVGCANPGDINHVPGEAIIQMEFNEDVDDLVANLNEIYPTWRTEVIQTLSRSLRIYLLKPNN